MSSARWPRTTMTSSRQDAAAASTTCCNKGRPSSERTCLGQPIRVEVPAARMMPERNRPEFASVGPMRGRAMLGQGSAVPAVPDGEDLGQNSQGDLLGGASAEIKADRGADASQIGL